VGSGEEGEDGVVISVSATSGHATAALV
jgi:hypothetical protein